MAGINNSIDSLNPMPFLISLSISNSSITFFVKLLIALPIKIPINNMKMAIIKSVIVLLIFIASTIIKIKNNGLKAFVMIPASG